MDLKQHDRVNSYGSEEVMVYREIIAVCSQIHTKHIIHSVGRT